MSVFLDILLLQFEEGHFVLQSRVVHEAQCELVEEDSDDESREYGINRRSILLDLKYFDICSGSLLPDVMHNILDCPLLLYS